jgi:hypothetical protein
MPVAAADSAGSKGGFNFSAVGLTPTQEALERTKWRAALVFYNKTGVMDLSYDGWFKSNNFAAIEKLVQYAQPDYWSMDIESFSSLEAWTAVGYQSANFQRLKVEGETNSQASVRFADSWIGGAATAAKAAAGSVKNVYLYGMHARFDAGFQVTSWPTAVRVGLSDSASLYSIENGLDVFARSVIDLDLYSILVREVSN